MRPSDKDYSPLRNVLILLPKKVVDKLAEFDPAKNSGIKIC